ncbi:GntR family transcriptional regulator [Lacisediminihabitans changchengi]|uniref:GntR family transcriptional regulator n=1 Tax=Lacisediminihabitans changchengi TaxID=2787634 RepID=A0A934SSP8_9MICO|nr:GntR family transcriptional regulator [Lacisediminihabitans changchengi]MBK4348293.1 GntR family transcriptional regulator [Lacisediminihabitans changchengi]
MALSRISGRKHEQIARVLAAEIRGGEVEQGQQLPGETTLAERFAVSRNTVRAALAELARAGLISTRSGKGSFVAYDGRPLNVRLGWARALEAQGLATEVLVLRAAPVTDPELAKELGEGSPEFVAIDRLRRIVGGAVISFEQSRVPALPAVLDAVDAGRASGSLTRMLLDCGLVAATGDQWVETRLLEEADARVLDRAPLAPFLWSRCITRNAVGELVERVDSLLDPAHFRLHFQFSAQE